MNQQLRQPLSVLLSLYAKTVAGEFRECLDSIAGQTRPPEEIVVVFDGPVDDAVRTALDDFEYGNDIAVRRLEYQENRGLGAALADGLAACSHDLVARVDTDDICLNHRFDRQVGCFETDSGLDVLGGWMEERILDRKGHSTVLVRRVPEEPAAIVRASRYRNPLNHPTVMLRRQRALDAGNYQSMLWFEDYFLWARMIQRGYRIRNLPEVLVTTATNDAYFSRRGGTGYLREELNLARKLRAIGFHTLWQSIRFIGTRALFRLVPLSMRGWLYARILRSI